MCSSCPAIQVNLSKKLRAPVNGSGAVSFDVEWIADSGAGRSLTSIQDLERQNIPASKIEQATASSDLIHFETGNGRTKSNKTLRTVGSSFGAAEAYILPNCPTVRSVGELVSSGIGRLFGSRTRCHILERMKGLSRSLLSLSVLFMPKVLQRSDLCRVHDTLPKRPRCASSCRRKPRSG